MKNFLPLNRLPGLQGHALGTRLPDGTPERLVFRRAETTPEEGGHVVSTGKS